MSSHNNEIDDKQQVKVEYDTSNNWVEIHFQGEMKANIAVSTLSKGIKLCEEKSCTRILFDARDIVLTETFMGGYDLAKHFSEKTCLGHEYKCCVIYDPRNYPSDRAETMETVAMNWGNFQLRMFSDLKLGVEWLKT